jgi:hypothetical protein
VTEWWQQGDDDQSVDVPRRDSVPSAEFSDPRLVTSSPELATFVPEFRRKRLAIAWIVTGVAIAVVAWSVFDLVRWTRAADLDSRAYGMVLFGAVLIRDALAVVSVWYVWRRALEGDPRDRRGGLRLDP